MIFWRDLVMSLSTVVLNFTRRFGSDDLAVSGFCDACFRVFALAFSDHL
jgi:hypothetical protein